MPRKEVEGDTNPMDSLITLPGSRTEGINLNLFLICYELDL